MKAKVWLISWLIIVITALCVFGYWVFKIDPFFHYHKPDIKKYFYYLNNQRSQNDGICKHFDYDALITGSSMTENFRTTEADNIFGFKSIKVAYSGGSYKEINNNIEVALSANNNLKTVIRCLDMGKFISPADDMRTDLGDYPTYLYDKNPFNDVEYLLNRDIVFSRVYQMTLDNNSEGFKPGIMSFDDYSRWQEACVFGINTVSANGVTMADTKQTHLTDEEKKMIEENIVSNVTKVADEYPDVDFYYFYSPYSVVTWNAWKTQGNLYKQLEAEAYITELIVPHENIHLFSFNNRTDITTNLNNYKDDSHYGSWINSLMLKWMHDGLYQLTKDNYKDYLKREYDFYTTFDYSSVNGQEDYEADYYAAALLNKELTGVDPLDTLNSDKIELFLNGAELIPDNEGRRVIVNCRGVLQRDNVSNQDKDKEYAGIKFDVDLDDGYNYLCFDGQKLVENGNMSVVVYDENGGVLRQLETDYSDVDDEVHHYAMDLSNYKGKVTVVLNGRTNDYSNKPDSYYQFSNVYLY